MIKNEREYRKIKSDVAKFQKTLKYLAEARVREKIGARKIQIQKEATLGILETLKRELKDYEALKTGKYKVDFEMVSALPLHLIKARITLNWTQRDLAKRVGTSEQQIQRYESTDYETASLATIRRISGVMQEQLSDRRN